MQQFNHHNVLRLLGVVIEGQSGSSIVMPFMANGNLSSYLCKNQESNVLNTILGIQEDYREARKLRKKIFRGLRCTSALRALDSKLRSKRGRCRTCSIANSGPTSWHWYPSFQMVV